MKQMIVKHWFRAIRNVGNTPHPSPMATPSPRRGRLGVFDLMAGAMAALFWVSACMVDSQSWVPTVICAVAVIYLTVYTYAGGGKDGAEYDRS